MNERLRKRRLVLGLTQAELAKKVGVDRSMISKIEAGAGCSLDVGLKIAKVLETTLEELFGASDETSAASESA